MSVPDEVRHAVIDLMNATSPAQTADAWRRLAPFKDMTITLDTALSLLPETPLSDAERLDGTHDP